MSLSEHSLNTGVIRKVSLYSWNMLASFLQAQHAGVLETFQHGVACGHRSAPPSLSPSLFTSVESTPINIYWESYANNGVCPPPLTHGSYKDPLEPVEVLVV